MDAEIAGIEATGTVRTLEGWQVNERYARVNTSAQRLTGNLRRALESARLADRRRVRELVGEIQRLALADLAGFRAAAGALGLTVDWREVNDPRFGRHDRAGSRRRPPA